MKIAPLLILFIFFANIWANPHKKDPQKSINLNVGFSRDLLADNYFSKLRFDGLGIRFGLNYDSKSEKHWWNIGANGGFGTISTSKDYFPTRLTSYKLSGLYTHRVTEIGPVEFYLGGKIQSRGQILNFEDYDNISWLAAHGFSLQTAFNFPFFKKHSIKLNISLPFLTYVSHPPYAGFDEKVDEMSEIELLFTGDWVTFNKFNHPELKLQYGFEINKHFQVGLQYLLSYLNSQEIHDSKAIENVFSVSSSFRFGSKK